MSLPSSPAGGGQPLQPVSHNAQRESALFSPSHHHRDRFDFRESAASARDSSVHEKITQFNTLAMQSKHHDRKAAETAAALKRAMIGREEAEAEMRRYRDEVEVLREEAAEVSKRERKVSQRLEEVMEYNAQIKESLAHTKQAYEKEIRRYRKETYKVQSTLVKAQEELKSCRAAQKAAEDELRVEQERSKVREQEAFDAQYKLVGLQQQLEQALGRVTMLEQELGALKTLAKNEAEVRRLASENDADDSDGPRKRARLSSDSDGSPEVEELTMLWEWEKQRADRALAQVDFLEAECQLKMCQGSKAVRANASRRKRTSVMISDAGDSMILSESRRASLEKPTPRRSKTDLLRVDKEPRRSTIFLPAEGIFRTVSQAEADAIATKTSAVMSPTESAPSMPITPTDSDPNYRRTPSVDPPDFAVLSKERTSLLSLLNAPHRREPTPVFNIPTTPGPAPGAHQPEAAPEEDTTTKPARESEISLPPQDPTTTSHQHTSRLTDPLPTTTTATTDNDPSEPTIPPPPRPHTTTAHYPTTNVTTTKVPLRAEPSADDGPTLAQRLLKMQRTPSRQTGHQQGEDVDPNKPCFDTTNPALTPTMTREQALAQIRERRGRARSVGRVGSGSGNGNGSTNGGGSGSGSANGSGTAAGGPGNRTSNGNGNGRVSANGGAVAGAGVNGEAAGRRKVSGSGSDAAGTGEVRRKVSGEMAGGRRVPAAGGEERGREREARREVSAPTSGAAARRGVSGMRRVRS